MERDEKVFPFAREFLPMALDGQTPTPKWALRNT